MRKNLITMNFSEKFQKNIINFKKKSIIKENNNF